MKIKEIWNWIKKVAKPEKQVREIEKDDPYAMVKHTTKTVGFRSMRNHNNRKRTNGRNIQYVEVNGISKPIYHGAK